MKQQAYDNKRGGGEGGEMNYRNARLANGFLSLDQMAGEVDMVKSRVVSDGGAVATDGGRRLGIGKSPEKRDRATGLEGQ